MTTPAAQESGLGLRDTERFLFLEARLADEHAYDAWEALWTDDALYWVPIGGTGSDPSRQVSLIHDNRRRIATRIAQLKTGKRHAQEPRSDLRRLLSNIEILGTEGEDTTVGANFLLVEARPRGKELWAGRTTYRLRREDGGIRLVGKTVVLVDSTGPVPTLSFLI
ncbi:aromatic-ring-hydroxylating dioxygenase subunit beta [Streptomyces sp. NPDC055078]